MAADGSMKALFNRAAMMLKMQRGNPFMKAVQARMDAAGETSGEEAAAYIAEAYENDRANAPASVQRWLADLLAAVKAWMFKKGIMGADRLTVADIAAVARANARSMARGGGATGWQGFGPAFSHAPAGDQTQTEAFKRWFSGSKAVDADGKPLRVYHGTGGDFTSFSTEKLGSNTGAASARRGFFFASNPKVSDFSQRWHSRT
jgi:glutathione S-transferase